MEGVRPRKTETPKQSQNQRRIGGGNTVGAAIGGTSTFFNVSTTITMMKRE
jgi:hypothetical protein